MEQSFAAGFNFYKLFWVYFIGSFIGVILETFWCMLRFRKFESRKGVIYGPFNPVYGLGALVMTLSLFWLKKERDLWVLMFGALIGSVYEYLCSFIQEKIFGSVSWDYKEFPLNLHGRINLLYCIFWGILALVWNKDIYPFISNIIENIPNEFGVSLTWICFIFTIGDILISGIAVHRMKQRLECKEASNKFWLWIDKHYPDKKLKRIYANMQFKKIGA